MTPEQEQMFQLQAVPEPMIADPSQVGQVGSMGEVEQVDIVNQGLAQTVAYMSGNGPVCPTHRGKAKTMTPAQLEEQKMREAQGLPSSPDEASRVVALEQKVQNVDRKLDAILVAIRPPRMSEMPPVVLPPTPPEKPDVVPPRAEYLFQPTENQIAPTYLPPAQETERQIPQSPPQYPPVSSVPNSLPTDFPEIIPPISKDSEGGTCIQEFDGPNTLEEVTAGEALAELVEVEPPVDAVEVKRLERQQILTDQVSNWLKSKDSHKFFRQFLSGACHKNLSYNTWPKEYQIEFDERFNQMVIDPVFITTLCGRITKMQMGHLVAPHVAGAFVAVLAGMLSFALMEE